MLPRIGIVLQKTGVDRYLTVTETVTLYASYYPKPRSPAEVVDLVGLTEKRNSRVTTLSGGQLRRLDMAVALAGDPDLLFLDEPTTGFDPSARREAWEVVKNLASLGKTVLLTTHYMDEAQYLADRVAVIADGQIVAEGPPGTLGDRNRAVGAHQVPATRRRGAAGRAGRRARRGRLHGDHVRRPGPRPAPAHRLGAGQRDRAWTGSRSPGRRSRTCTCR